ncbi:tetratricopeptide repeat protein [Mangrovivirga cuniculi]|uniref:Sel1 repeat family protein n=1 Tax=Mangrovivirga cuniculi TaxID=2715131 RepID=A0A4D7JW06_9BACT|nr:tetratricopeptide repeat protein [Mangrovivirga cuniculi]QCK16702.1 hypothetical protein DCC35_19170 [Mangrovivirga cuniculi]
MILFSSIQALGQDFEKFYEEGNYDAIKVGAQAGMSEAQFFLGKMYANGKGEAKDIDKALKYYRKAADQGNAKAMNNIGVQYYSGKNIPQDYAKAIYWWEKASELGNQVSTRNLGVVYRFGRGVDKDLLKASNYFNDAVDNGNYKAYLDLGYMHESEMEDYQSAMIYFSYAAKNGVAAGFKEMGDVYRYGKGINRNLSIAKRLYEKAVEEGDTNAKEQLEKLEQLGVIGVYEPVPHDKIDGEYGKDVFSTPVFFWTSPNSEQFDEMANNEVTYDYYGKYGFNEDRRHKIAEILSKNSKNQGVSVIQKEGYFTLSHEPQSGYSKWVFPDFKLRTSSKKYHEYHFKKVFYLNISIPEGKAMAEMKLPIELRTSICPTSGLYIRLKKNGKIYFEGVNSKNKDRESVFISKEAFKDEERIAILFSAYSSGYWTIQTNKGDVLSGYGALKEDFIKGSSNHCFFEGDINIHEIQIYEDYAFEDEEIAMGLKSEDIQNIQRNIGKKLGDYANRLFKFSNQYDFNGWEYLNHQITFLERQTTTIKGSEDAVIKDDKSFVYYSVGTLIKGKNSKGEIITLPVNNTIGINEKDMKLVGLHIESEFEDKEVVIINDLESFLLNEEL